MHRMRKNLRNTESDPLQHDTFTFTLQFLSTNSNTENIQIYYGGSTNLSIKDHKGTFFSKLFTDTDLRY